MNVTLDRDSRIPLYAQIRDALGGAIERGEYGVGDRLPAVAELAEHFGVTRATILRAFEDLAGGGRIISHVGRGTFVADPLDSAPEQSAGEVDASRASARSATTRGAPDADLHTATWRMRMGIARGLQALLALADRPGVISFNSGVPDPALVPPDLLGELSRRALAWGERRFRDYGPAGGLPELREAIAERLSRGGTRIAPEQVLVTSGSQQGISILAQHALEQDLRVHCETPCYMGIPHAFGAAGHWVESVPREEGGPSLARLDELRGLGPSIFYCVPDCHNALGTDIEPSTRNALIDWAEAEDATLVVDDLFRDLHFAAKPPAAMLHAHGTSCVISVSSLSKSFMCGLRIGWLVASRERVDSLLPLKRVSDLGCPPLMEGIALELLRSGQYDEHTERARAHYRERRDACLEALEASMPDGLRWTEPTGGFHLWVDLPRGYSSMSLFLLSVERGVAFQPGPQMDIDHRFVSSFRLSYGTLAPERIREGVRLLGDAVRKLLAGPPSEIGLTGIGTF